MAGARYPTRIFSLRTSGLEAAMASGVGKALVSACPSLSFGATRPADGKGSPNSFTSFRVIFLVAAQSVFVVRMVLITSSKRVGERRTLPRASFLARASFGSAREDL